MRRSRYLITAALAVLLAACATPQPPLFQKEALSKLVQVYKEGGETMLPVEFRSISEAYLKADALWKKRERDEAQRYYHLALLKGELAEKEVAALKARRQEEARREAEEKMAELARQAQAEASRLAQAQAEALARKEAAEAARRKAARPAKEQHVLVSSYTVRRGESLPFVASQPEVYGDRMLWPLIYRANRDQIRDPRHIWPGQLLRIPRNLSAADIAEAKRYAQERPLR